MNWLLLRSSAPLAPLAVLQLAMLIYTLWFRINSHVPICDRRVFGAGNKET